MNRNLDEGTSEKKYCEVEGSWLLECCVEYSVCKCWRGKNEYSIRFGKCENWMRKCGKCVVVVYQFSFLSVNY